MLAARFAQAYQGDWTAQRKSKIAAADLETRLQHQQSRMNDAAHCLTPLPLAFLRRTSNVDPLACSIQIHTPYSDGVPDQLSELSAKLSGSG